MLVVERQPAGPAPHEHARGDALGATDGDVAGSSIEKDGDLA